MQAQKSQLMRCCITRTLDCTTNIGPICQHEVGNGIRNKLEIDAPSKVHSFPQSLSISTSFIFMPPLHCILIERDFCFLGETAILLVIDWYFNTHGWICDKFWWFSENRNVSRNSPPTVTSSWIILSIVKSSTHIILLFQSLAFVFHE